MKYSPELIIKLKHAALTKSSSNKPFGVQRDPWNGRVMRMFADEDYHRNDQAANSMPVKYKIADVWLVSKIATAMDMWNDKSNFSTLKFPYTDEIIQLNNERLKGTMTDKQFEELYKQALDSPEGLSHLV